MTKKLNLISPLIFFLLGGILFASIMVKNATIAHAEEDVIVARAGDITITRKELYAFMQTLPENVRNANDPQILKRVEEIMLQTAFLADAGRKAGLENDEEVMVMLKNAELAILRDKFLAVRLAKVVTDEKINAEYQKYLDANPPKKEVRARHILVKSKDEADNLIKSLDDGGDFEELAKIHSTGPSGANGGDLGYFDDKTMVPEFSKAAFALEKGNYTKAPVQTQFGWHVILVEDIREVTAPPLEELRPQLVQSLSIGKTDEIIAEIIKDTEFEYFDLYGEKLP